MSASCLVRLIRCSGSNIGRSGLLQKAFDPLPFQLDSHKTKLPLFCRQVYGPSGRQYSNTRFDPDGSGRLTTWDSFGIWDDRIDEPIMLPPSIRYGKPIPKVSLSKIGCASLIGQRKENEDRFQVSQLNENTLYFAVFDGHGGSEAADFCEKYMKKFIQDILAEDNNLESALKKAFLEVDKALAKHLHFYPNGPGTNAGTTATVALLRDGIELVVASVGDSRAMLCRKGKALKLTVDHTPERRDEKERIKKSGGYITWNSLGQPNVNGRLAMTRSIGDFDLKKMGVIAEPETKRLTLHHVHDSFLALTTDGINFIMNSQEICNVINQCHDPKEAAQRISDQALHYGTEDNSTIIVVPFGAWGKHKSSDVSFSFSRSFVSSGRWA
ncbi:protein phosphatase 1K, mitochondrial [Xiphophorus maculatus]|uniref:protein-serine/threonine phosphatase n=2 Tax=Xiphophorus TaxID=8082 RepID=M4A660_XIPMA|nr:protein phosphatase 1K, mitochondrial [Xiphophorus maculatus]XP_023189846.1 protein phosphatase 1K, mitochondrial [Xiphophorus maculatus]XP_027875095.1 protein phosphatase 1K, mitochondrial [Xiphophorus couchianus]XP_027875097.1 protein phosphatase 1K, mitochondrial [Xiphophorus couchianus]XP_027875098.1 protein phosphatase 1K, mitochondrial [Xiphophorus couchianus]